MRLRGGALERSLSVGLSHGGDAETGSGVEADAGLAWSDPVLDLASDRRLYGLEGHEAGGCVGGRRQWSAVRSQALADTRAGRINIEEYAAIKRQASGAEWEAATREFYP